MPGSASQADGGGDRDGYVAGRRAAAHHFEPGTGRREGIRQREGGGTGPSSRSSGAGSWASVLPHRAACRWTVGCVSSRSTIGTGRDEVPAVATHSTQGTSAGPADGDTGGVGHPPVGSRWDLDGAEGGPPAGGRHPTSCGRKSGRRRELTPRGSQLPAKWSRFRGRHLAFGHVLSSSAVLSNA
jgi:hypothetical protein